MIGRNLCKKKKYNHSDESRLLFIEQFACYDFDSFLGAKYAKEFVERMIRDKKRKHLILNGPPGTGKKTLIRLYLQALKEQYQVRNESDFCLYFRCSSERCIQSIRTTIQSFVKSKASRDTKFIVFEDAETVSDGVQQLMRSIIDSTEKFSCILLCHDNSKIIQPLQNKSFVINMPSLTYDDLSFFLFSITKKYPLSQKSMSQEWYEDMFRVIIDINKGNIRKILNSLEYLHCYVMANNVEINKDTIKSITVLPIYEEVSKLFCYIQNRELHLAFSIFDNLLNRGFRPFDLLFHLQQYLKNDEHFQFTNPENFNKCINLLALTIPRVTQINQPRIQMISCLCHLSEVFIESKLKSKQIDDDKTK